MKSRSVLRNPTIVNIFRDYGGFIEKVGTGIRRMSHAMQEHHLPMPKFDELSGEFLVTLIGPGQQFMQDENSPPWTKELTNRQVQAVDFVLKKGSLSNENYQQLANVVEQLLKEIFKSWYIKAYFKSAEQGGAFIDTLNPKWSPR